MLNGSKESIEATRTQFEASFESGAFYDRQTQDRAHLQSILNCLNIQDHMKILDLGTGTGYLAFPIAELYTKTDVTGLDIVDITLNKNQEKAENAGLNHLKFVSYDGITFPFEDGAFDMVITRYALHHFPAVHDTFQEINRVLKPEGLLFLSDPAPNDNDTERFVDAYMQMKKDGHIQFYTKAEWEIIGKATGFRLLDGFETSIRFPKKRQTALEFDAIMSRFSEDVIKGYDLKLTADEIWLTERVNNLLFRKVPVKL